MHVRWHGFRPVLDGRVIRIAAFSNARTWVAFNKIPEQKQIRIILKSIYCMFISSMGQAVVWRDFTAKLQYIPIFLLDSYKIFILKYSI
jgi:hypothetical protein